MSAPGQAVAAPEVKGAPLVDDRGILRRVLRRPVGAVSLAFLTAVSLGCLFASKLAPFNPLKADFANVKAGPSWRHLLGTDALGRDLLSRLLYGGRASLFGVLEVLAVTVALGLPAGLVAGYFGGRFDRLLAMLTDIVLSIPAIVFLLLILSIYRANLHVAMFTLGCLLAPGLMRVIRASTLSVRNELYVSAARTSGLSHTAIIVRHVLRRIVGAAIVQLTIAAGVALGVQSGLAFVGLAIKPPSPSWGFDLADASTLMVETKWQLVPPGAVIGLSIMAFGLLGDALRDANAERMSSNRSRRRVTPPTVLPAAGPSTAALSVHELTIAFDGPAGPVVAVDRISFDVEPGETLGLVGESGCGKTLSVLGVMGLLPGTGRIVSGSVRLGGTEGAGGEPVSTELVGMDARSLRSVRGRRIAYIAQEPMSALNPAFRVGQLLDAAVRLHHGVDRRSARARTLELLRTVRLPEPEGVAARYPHELSGGMAQRVAIALALSGEPEVLIADEPTTALDVTVQAEILDLLRSLQESQGMAIVLVTHDWGVICDLATRAVVMYAGQLTESADVTTLVRAPRHPYTAALLASDPHRNHDDELPTIPGTVPPPGSWPAGCHFATRCAHATEACTAAPVELVDVHALRRSASDATEQRPTEQRPMGTHVVRCVRADELAVAHG